VSGDGRPGARCTQFEHVIGQQIERVAGEHPPIPGVDQLEASAIDIRAGAVTRLHGQEAEPSGRVSCLCVRGHARNHATILPPWHVVAAAAQLRNNYTRRRLPH
jgi:hypothetical protein